MMVRHSGPLEEGKSSQYSWKHTATCSNRTWANGAMLYYILNSQETGSRQTWIVPIAYVEKSTFNTQLKRKNNLVENIMPNG